MRLAYLITAYKHPSLFRRMFRAIYDPDNHYLVHIDRKSAPEYHREIRAFLADYPNARLMRSRNWVYGGFSAVEIQLAAMKELLVEPWDFFINTTGQDFPLKTQAQIREFLQADPSRNHIDVRDQRRLWPESLFRLEWYFVELRGPVPLPRRKRVIPLPWKRRFPKDVTPYAGSTWFVLNRRFCEYVCQPQNIERPAAFYRNTYIPEEGFFQTVIMHSPFKDTVVSDCKRLVLWPGGRIHTFTEADYPLIERSDAFFARKFDETKDAKILERLEARLEGR